MFKRDGQALEEFINIILIQLLSSSIIMISLGIIGYYIAEIYEEIRAIIAFTVLERVNARQFKQMR